MNTATDNPKSTQPVAPIDPERDIDGAKTALWLGVAFLFVIVSMWVLSQIFAYALAGAHATKIENVPPTELQALRAKEDYWLKKAVVPATDSRSLSEIQDSIQATTNSVIQDYVK